MTRTNRVLVLLSFLFLQLLTAGEEAEVLTLTADEIPQPYIHWYGLYGPDGVKLGCCRMELFGKTDDSFRVAMDVRIKLAAKGKQVEARMKQEKTFAATAPFGLISGVETTTTGNTPELSVSVQHTGTAYMATVKQGDSQRQIPVPQIAETLSEFLGGEVWVRRKTRTLGENFQTRSFSLQNLASSTAIYKITAVRESIVAGTTVKYYEFSCYSAEHGDMGTARVATDGTMICMKLGAMFEARLEPEEFAQKIEYSSDLFVFGIARIDKPLGDPHKILRMSVEATGPHVDKFPNSPEQTIVRDEKNSSCILRTGKGNGESQKATSLEIQSDLKETPTYPVNDLEVKELARQACGDANDAKDKVQRLVRFVYGYLKKQTVLGHLTVKEIIALKKGDCSHHARLFTALARASGISAREVHGLAYMGDDARSFGGHAWNEVVLDGCWVPVDSTWNETEVDGAHIRFAAGEKWNNTWLFGQVTFKLIELELRK